MHPLTAPSPPAETASLGAYDLVIVGAGILGLAHAWHAMKLGLSIAVVERDERAVGASIRNFGHACVTAQSGLAREYADLSRTEWLRLGELAGLGVQEAGTVVVARSEQEEAVLAEFAAQRGDEVQLLGADETAATLGLPSGERGEIRSGARLGLDLRVDPLIAVSRLAEHLQSGGVTFFFGTNVGTVEPGRVQTSRGSLSCRHIVVSVGHDVDRFFPAMADAFEVQRCRLRMLEIDPPRGVAIDPAIFTGLSLLRYDAFLELESSRELRAHFEAQAPELLAHDLNHMITQRPDGGLIVGDTHHRSRTETPFENERSDELVLAETARLFGVTAGASGLRVRKHWRGVYASSSHTNFLCEMPLPGVRVASVTSGIGMTTSLGFARDSLERLLDPPHPQLPTENHTHNHNAKGMK